MEDGPYEDLLHMVKNSIATFGKPECLFTTKVNYKDTSAKTHPQNWCFRIRESSPKNALIIQENVPTWNAIVYLFFRALWLVAEIVVTAASLR